MTGDRLDIVFVSDSSESNSLGRVFSLWKLAEASGLSSLTVAASGDAIWSPVSGTAFAETVVLGGNGSTIAKLRPRVIVCVKPLPLSFALAWRAHKGTGVPMILDIDDPDIEAGLSYGDPLRRLAKAILRPRRTVWFLRARRAARALPVMVSNPVLQRDYGGTLIPHVRDAVAARPAASGGGVTIAFVGTNRPHKGINVLRDAVARVAARGFRLIVTDDEPADARVWESWVGRTSLDDGLALAAQADVAVIPSLDTRFSQGQLPAKLVDAMMAGKPIVASDLPSIAWALGDSGILVPAGDPNAIAEALESLEDGERRAELGAAAGVRAAEVFGVERNAEVFADLIRTVASRGSDVGNG